MRFATWSGGDNLRVTPPPDSDLRVLAENTRQRAWTVTVLATIALLTTLIHRQTLAALAVTVTSALSISDVRYGWLSTGMAASFMIGSLPAARLTQRIGPQMALAIAVAFTSLVIGLHSLVAGFLALLILRIGMGFAAAWAMPAAIQTVHRVLPFKDRARGIALLYMGSSLGSAVCAPIAVVFDSLVGWRWAFFGVAAIGILWVPAWAAATILSQPRGSINSLGPPQSATDLNYHVSVAELARHRGVLRGALLVAAASPINLIMLIWAAKYLARDHDVAQSALGHYLWMPPLMFGAGSLGFGELRARTARNRSSARPPRRLVALASLISCIVVSVPFATSAPMGIALAGVAMVGAGGLYTLATSDMLAHTPRQAVPAATSLTTVTQSIVYVVASPIIGKVVEHFGNFDWVMVGAGLWVLPCALVWLLEATFHECPISQPFQALKRGTKKAYSTNWPRAYILTSSFPKHEPPQGELHMAPKAETTGDSWNVVATSGRVPLSEGPFEMPFVSGEIIADKYEVIDLVGVGGVGFVVAANHIELGEKVALKFLRPEMLFREEVVARFAREALAAVRIKNEHVARVIDVGSLPNNNPFIVMEFLEGRDLYNLVQREGPLPVKRAIDCVLQACEALADAHARGIVHRDVKPENLFLIQRSEGIDLIKVLDFGISKVALTGSAIRTKVPLIRTMLPMGSPVYMSPEQIRASKDIDARTDIWSMGCVLHELLTGSPAFDAPSLTQLSATILEEHPPKVSESCPAVPRELDAIVARCLEKSPDKRFQNMAELAVALYPFGPRRSRLSAERCCQLLRVEGSVHPEFELPSARPPGWETLPSGAYPSLKDPARSSATGAPLIDANSASLSGDRETLVVARKPRRKALVVGIVSGVLSVVIGAATGLSLQSNGEAPKPDATIAAPSRAEPKPLPSPDTKQANDVTGASRATSADAAPLHDGKATPSDSDANKSRPAGTTRTINRPAKAKRKASTGRAESSASDPDPGF